VDCKDEFPPLLPAGFHHKSVAEIEELCVSRFPLSVTRKEIMVGLHTILKRIAAVGITGEIWLNGSFVTEKIDPSDCDFVAMIPAEFHDAGTVAQRAMIEWLISKENEPKKLFKCDAYVHLKYSGGSPEHDLWLPTLNRWQDNFGHSVKTRQPKGIVVLDLEKVLI
jgi:hypothetical protein